MQFCGFDLWTTRKRNGTHNLSAPTVSPLLYCGRFLPLGNKSKNHVWSCSFHGTSILQEPQTQIYEMSFLKVRTEDQWMSVTANSNVLYQFQWGTVGPLLCPFLSFSEGVSELCPNILCQCWVCSLSNVSPLLGHMLRFISSTVAWLTVFHFQWWDRVPSSGWNCILLSNGRDFFPSWVEMLPANYFQIT